MSEEAKAVQEAAKAVQEVAKTAAIYEGAIERFGAFIGKIVGPPVFELSGLMTDAIKARRVINGLKFEERYNQLLLYRKIAAPKPIPLSIAMPLLDAATLEDNPDLAEMFANLLVTYTANEQPDHVPKRFIETLRSLTPFEANLLKLIGAAPSESITAEGFIHTGKLHNREYLPGQIHYEIDASAYVAPTNDVMLALDCLQQAGCIRGMMIMSGIVTFEQVTLTSFGSAFLEACGAFPERK